MKKLALRLAETQSFLDNVYLVGGNVILVKAGILYTTPNDCIQFEGFCDPNWAGQVKFLGALTPNKGT